MRRVLTVALVLGLAVWPKAESMESPIGSSAMGIADQSSAAEPLAIVVNRRNPIDDLSFSDLRAIFLGNRSHWSDGRRITLVMRQPGDVERRVVLRDVCNLNEDQFKLHFLHGLYTGDILVSPKTLDTPLGVKKFIFNVPGAIGYLRASDVDDTVKVIRIDELLPDGKGYRLHMQ